MLSSSSRLLRVLSLLQARRHWAGAELAERLGVHPRTLRRDIDRLRELGYPIHASSGVAGGYAFRAGQALPPLLLDDEEAQAVAIALQTAAAGTVSGVEEGSLRALVKLEQVMPARLRRRIDALRSAILPLESLRPTVDAGVLASLALACRDQLRLAFAYRDSRGQGTARSVEPQGLVHTGSRWYLVAWDMARVDWRTFRLDRIDGAPTLGGHFAPRAGPEGGDLRAYVSRSIGVSAYNEQARVVLHQPLEAMARRIPPTVARLEAWDGGRCVMHSGAHHLESLAYWLLALDVEFEVLEPPTLTALLQKANARVARALARSGGGEGGPAAGA
ncbi:MAG: YafY family transcriptional regulator [Comamonadaceae bacterium]|jgi:predicted DNA-binding transcriptional regulator YafY|uniref:YafY family transcriptional regulator n=1 Tax=Hydrogenophaga borbori TaxID=2294117 RepID=A0A372ENN6_9BURK|nr:YafY family protein [Hydrogenophaga borbori]NCT96251.1 YafY family transcriptional regulator [Comamonadaceae bacterium]RFP81216.1 YafY family transcriptional regulator [Hydrogenophaga borbori]